MDPNQARMATELFVTTAAPALVRDVVGILEPLGIPVMPLKGVLLQPLVYRDRGFRPLTDVDLLVPPRLFVPARRALGGAGYAVSGAGEDIFRRPGHLLEVDLHRRLSTTTRSLLAPDDMFHRGRADKQLFGACVVIPSPEDLYAHLLLHLTLHWVNHGALHHPDDLELVPEVLGLSVPSVLQHLMRAGLDLHAQLMLPLLTARRPDGFSGRLRAALRLPTRRRARVAIVRELCVRSTRESITHRAGGALLAPSLTKAAREALLGRLLNRQRSSADR